MAANFESKRPAYYSKFTVIQLLVVLPYIIRSIDPGIDYFNLVHVFHNENTHSLFQDIFHVSMTTDGTGGLHFLG